MAPCSRPSWWDCLAVCIVRDVRRYRGGSEPGNRPACGASGDAHLAGAPWRLLLTYNLGRILSYTLAGAIAGGAGWFAARMTDVNQAQLVLQVVCRPVHGGPGSVPGRMVAGPCPGGAGGRRVWRRMEPLGRRFMPVREPRQALALGLVWGWLPCGLVYSVLIWSIASGGFVQGAALMAAFGLGTLPNLLLMGAMAARLGGFLRRAWVRGVAGAAGGRRSVCSCWCRPMARWG
jgi:uncharacterized protein